MPNKLEQLAQKKRQEAADAREAEIRELASVIADETLSRIENLSASNKKTLEASISELAVAIAESIAVSNSELIGKVDASLSELVDKVRTTIPVKVDNSANEALFTRVAQALVSFDKTVGGLKLDPTINFDGATEADIKKHIDRLIKALPDIAKSSVKIEYENIAPTNYINVRLTDGLNFYKALGGGGGGGGTPTPTIETEDGIGVPVVNPDGSPVGSTPSVASASSDGILVGTSSTTLLAANESRISATIVNDSDEVMYLKLGAGAELNSGIRINSKGGSAEIDDYTGEITAICLSGGKNATVTEL